MSRMNTPHEYILWRMMMFLFSCGGIINKQSTDMVINEVFAWRAGAIFFNWCPSDPPVVRVELRDITPRTAITKETHLLSLANMLSRLKPPCITTSHK